MKRKDFFHRLLAIPAVPAVISQIETPAAAPVEIPKAEIAAAAHIRHGDIVLYKGEHYYARIRGGYVRATPTLASAQAVIYWDLKPVVPKKGHLNWNNETFIQGTKEFDELKVVLAGYNNPYNEFHNPNCLSNGVKL